MSVVDVNKEFYNKLYRKRNPLVSLVYSLISFDQQSKSKVNYKVVKRILKEKLNNELTVLDYGFGHGSLLLKYGSHHHLYGCDISEEAVHNFPRVARLAGKNVVTVTVDEFEKKYTNVRFDVINLSHIIEHIADNAVFLKSLSAKLADDGLILINVPINEVWEDPKHVRKYDYMYTENLVAACGLRVVYRLETDKLTSFFLIEEKVKSAGTLKIYLIKSMRLLFAIAPTAIVRAFEKVFLSKHRNQQLVVVVKKK